MWAWSSFISWIIYVGVLFLAWLSWEKLFRKYNIKWKMIFRHAIMYHEGMIWISVTMYVVASCLSRTKWSQQNIPTLHCVGSWVQSKFSENDHSWISYSDIIYFILIPLVPSPIFLPRIDMMFSIYSRVKVWWRSVNLKNNFSSFVFGAMKFQEKKAFGIYWLLQIKRLQNS